MADKIRCARCGISVEKVCSSCWRCSSCKLDCPDHMKRIIDGVVGKNKSSR